MLPSCDEQDKASEFYTQLDQAINLQQCEPKYYTRRKNYVK